jgi:hypothetical protein
VACICCNPSACLPGFECRVAANAYFSYSISISTPPLTYFRFPPNGSSCTTPITVPAATGSIEFISTLRAGDPGYMIYPSRAGRPRVNSGWRSSTIYNAPPPPAGMLLADIGTGIRDFFFAQYTTQSQGSAACRTNILGSMSLLLDPNLDSPTLSNVDALGPTYVGDANPQCVNTQPRPLSVAVYFTAIPRLYDRTVYNCVSGTYELFHLDIAATGGSLPPEDAARTSFVPNGPKVGTITIGPPP